MSRIVLESKAPTWQKADLRMTRVKDTDRGELLIFKELSWQTVRIEAKSTMSEDLTPLRLITNQARCRITIKKKLSGMWAMHYLVVSLLGFEFQVWLGVQRELETDARKLNWPKNWLLMKNSYFLSDQVDILVILRTHELSTLTKLHGNGVVQ